MKQLKLKSFHPFLVYRTVDYFGIQVEVPKEDCWIATDRDGRIYVHTKEPRLKQEVGEWCSEPLHYRYSGLEADLEQSDMLWQSTLQFFEMPVPKIVQDFGFTVNYHGLEIRVPNGGYVCVDGHGFMYWFESKPERSGMQWENEHHYDEWVILHKVDIPGLDWKQSIVEVTKPD